MSWKFSSVAEISIAGVYWRMRAPRWSFDPLSGAGAARGGGRWNEPGQAALYLSKTHGTAIAEYHQDLPRPGTLTGYAVATRHVLDLADPEKRSAIGLDAAFLRQPWKRDRDIGRIRPTCWEFARQAAERGYLGLRVPSVQAPGNNLVLWQWTLPDLSIAQMIDPAGDLPRDQLPCRK